MLPTTMFPASPISETTDRGRSKTGRIKPPRACAVPHNSKQSLIRGSRLGTESRSLTDQKARLASGRVTEEPLSVGCSGPLQVEITSAAWCETAGSYPSSSSAWTKPPIGRPLRSIRPLSGETSAATSLPSIEKTKREDFCGFSRVSAAIQVASAARSKAADRKDAIRADFRAESPFPPMIRPKKLVSASRKMASTSAKPS